MEKLKEAKLSAKGQITVPKQVREKLGVDSGDAIVFYFDDDVVKLTSTRNLNISPKNRKKQGVVQKGENKNG